MSLSNTPFPPGPLPPDVPFQNKWELLKPFIVDQYVNHKVKLSELMQVIKTRHGFDASETQYKYQINRKWQLTKILKSAKKDAICKKLQRGNDRPAVVEHQGQNVNAKLRRHLKNARRQIQAPGLMQKRDNDEANLSPGPSVAFKNSVFLYWNMPYGIMRGFNSGTMNHTSPSGSASTPSDVIMTMASSPPAQTSSFSTELKKRRAIDRAHLFVRGEHDQLIKSMNQAERKTMSTWLYQFWFYAFKTAKYWGQGPRNWNAEFLEFENFKVAISSIPNTPGANFSPSVFQHTPSDITMAEGAGEYEDVAPSSLCRWAVHVHEMSYKRLPSPPRDTNEVYDLDHPEGWPKWPDGWKKPEFQDRLRNGLENNDFSSVKAKDLPVAVGHIVAAAEKSPEELLAEAVGFSILGHNAELLEKQLGSITDKDLDVNLENLYPFHLAASYLDGAGTCCGVFEELMRCAVTGRILQKTYENRLGHTILDNFMITILKSHTYITPGQVEDSWKNEKNFVGVGVDICGRWDSDSACFRRRLERGKPTIPKSWKHKFCHTSIQTICHCIRVLFGFKFSPPIDTPSGLFVKRCLQCGIKLQLRPLHTLVLTAAYLGSYGFEGEDLFGILACLLCLLANGADPTLTAEISVSALAHEQTCDSCDQHEEITASDLAQRIGSTFSSNWSSKVNTGWQVVCYVLRSSVEERKQNENFEGAYQEAKMGYDNRMDELSLDQFDDEEENHVPFWCYDEHSHYFGVSPNMAILWAAVQTELLTYRKLKEGDPWISEHFSMKDLLEGLCVGEGIRVGLVEKELMNPFCYCGRFEGNNTIWGHPVVGDACKEYFANLDCWDRATYLDETLTGILADFY